MEERRTIRTQGQIIEEYRRSFPEEVVETYRRSAAPAPAAQSCGADPVRLADEASAQRQRSGRGLTVFLLCMIGLCLLVLGALLYARAHPARAPFRDEPPDSYYAYDDEDYDEPVEIPAYPTGEGAELSIRAEHGAELSAQEIYRRVNPAVVTVMCQGEQSSFVGTGVIFRADGYILTNRHIVSGGRRCSVLLESDELLEARYVASDTENDLAVLKVDAAELPAAEFGDSDLLTVGDPVYAIGSPLSVNLRGTLTNGIVSAINRDVEVGQRTMTLIQTNAALNNGNSGGPLINRYGQVVGINVIKMYSGYSTVEGLGFSIPSASMERIVNDLLTYGALQPEPLLGVSVLRTADTLEDGRRGLEIVEVTEGAPAARAGVQAGDYLLAVDGTEALTSDAVLKARRRRHLGDEMVFTLWRNGETFDVTLRLTDAVE